VKLANFFASEGHLRLQLNDLLLELVDRGLEAERLLGTQCRVRLSSDSSTSHANLAVGAVACCAINALIGAPYTLTTVESIKPKIFNTLTPVTRVVKCALACVGKHGLSEITSCKCVLV